MTILFRAKRTDNGEWIQGFYVQRVLQVNSMIADHAIQKPGVFPVEIDINTLCQYREDINAFEGDWIEAETTHFPPQQVQGALVFSDMEYCLETNDNQAPLVCFGVIDRLSIKVTGKNIYDNPEIATFLEDS